MGAHVIDERRVNTVVFLASVAAYAVMLFDVEGRVWIPLLLPPAAFLARVFAPRLPAWGVLLITAPIVAFVNIDLRAEGAFFLVVLGAFSATAIDNRRFPTWTLVVLAALIPIPIQLGDPPVDQWNWPFWTMGTLISAFFGSVLFQQRALTRALTDAQEQLADKAAGEERRRIAREVHDLVGHSLTVVVLHVAGARRLVRRDPAEAEQALADAERAGRGALADIRQTVALLRDSGDTFAPTPNALDLPALIDESRAAGMVIETSLAGPLDELDETTGLTSYRIVQEALANAARHAAGSTAHVTIAVTGDQVTIDVINAGDFAAPSEAGGSGLVGMHERAAALGGSLTVGPVADGWQVRAVLPRSLPVAGPA